MPGKPGLKNCSINTDFDYDVCDDQTCHQYRTDGQSLNRKNLLNYLQRIEKSCQPDSSYCDYQSSTSEDRRQGRKPLRKQQAPKTGKLVDYVREHDITADCVLGSSRIRGEPTCQASGRDKCQDPRGRQHPRNFEQPVDSFWRGCAPRDTSSNFDESSPKRRWRRCAEASPTFYGRYARRGDACWPKVRETSSFEVIRDRYVEQNSQTSDREEADVTKRRNASRSVHANLTTDTESTVARLDEVGDCCDARRRTCRGRLVGGDRHEICVGGYDDRRRSCANRGDLRREEVCGPEDCCRTRRRATCKQEFGRTGTDPRKEEVCDCRCKDMLRQSLNRVCCDGGTIRKHSKSADPCRRAGRLPEKNQTAVCQCCVETARKLKQLSEPLHSLRAQKTKQWLDRQEDHGMNQCADSANEYRPAKCGTKHSGANAVCPCKGHGCKRDIGRGEAPDRSVPRNLPQSRSPVRTDKTCLPPSQDQRLPNDTERCCRVPPEAELSDVNRSPTSLKQAVRPQGCKAQGPQSFTGPESPSNESPKDRNRSDKVPDLRNCTVEGTERTGKVCRNEFKLDDLTPDVTIDHWRMYGKRWDKMTEEYRKLAGTLKTTQTEAESEIRSPGDRVRKRLTRSYPSGKEFSFEVRTPARKEYATCPPGSSNMADRDRGQNPRQSPEKIEGCRKECLSKDADLEFRKKHEARWHRNLFPNSEVENMKRCKMKNFNVTCCDACSWSEMKPADSKKEAKEAKEACKQERITKCPGHTGVKEKCEPCSPTRNEGKKQVHNEKCPTRLTTQIPCSPTRNKVKNDASPVREPLCSPRKFCPTSTSNKVPAKHIEHPVQYVCAQSRKLKNVSPSSENRSPRCCFGSIEYDRASSESCPPNTQRALVYNSRRTNGKSATTKCEKMVRRKSAKGCGRSNTRKIQIPPPHDDKCPPLTLYKSSSTINCEVQGDCERGYRYNVTYVQKFVSSRWCPTNRKSHRFMEHRCECSSDYG